MQVFQNVPLDIESIQKIGFEKWKENFSWPFGWQEYLELEYKVKHILNELIITNTKYSKLVFINYKVFLDFSNLLGVLLLLEKTKGQHLISNHNLYFKSVEEIGVPNKPLINFPECLKKSLFSYLKTLLLLYLKDNRLYPPALFQPNVHILLEGRSLHTLEYVRRHFKGRIRTMSFHRYHSKGQGLKVSEVERKEIENVVKQLIDKISLLANEYSLQLNEIQKKFLFDNTLSLFVKSYDSLLKVSKGLGRRKIDLYIGANRNYQTRIMSVAVRNNGGKVHGFTHGEPVIYDWDKISWMELSLNDYYYEYSGGLAAVLTDYYSTHKIFENKVKIKSFSTEIYSKFNRHAQSLTKIGIPNETPKVMVMGSAFKIIEIGEVTGPYAPLQLHIEHQIIDGIMNLGYSVVYKKHPGGDLKDKEYPHSGSLHIIEKPFEQTFSEADILVFYNTRSTTFGYAIASNKPIIIIDLGIEKMVTKLKQLIDERCYRVSAKFSPENQLLIDNDKLEVALNQCYSFNDKYLESYLQ